MLSRRIRGTLFSIDDGYTTEEPRRCSMLRIDTALWRGVSDACLILLFITGGAFSEGDWLSLARVRGPAIVAGLRITLFLVVLGGASNITGGKTASIMRASETFYFVGIMLLLTFSNQINSVPSIAFWSDLSSFYFYIFFTFLSTESNWNCLKAMRLSSSPFLFKSVLLVISYALSSLKPAKS